MLIGQGLKRRIWWLRYCPLGLNSMSQKNNTQLNAIDADPVGISCCDMVFGLTLFKLLGWLANFKLEPPALPGRSLLGHLRESNGHDSGVWHPSLMALQAGHVHVTVRRGVLVAWPHWLPWWGAQWSCEGTGHCCEMLWMSQKWDTMMMQYKSRHNYCIYYIFEKKKKTVLDIDIDINYVKA